MFVLIGALLGAVIGSLTARRRKGRIADILLYGAVHALIFAVLGLFLTLIVHRSLL